MGNEAPTSIKQYIDRNKLSRV